MKRPVRTWLRVLLVLGVLLVLCPLGAAEAAPPGPWSATDSMLTDRAQHTAVLLQDGTVLVAGGRDYALPHWAAELYNPKTGKWRSAGDMREIRVGHTATLLNDGKVLVAGGATSGGLLLNTAELYDPATQTWSFTGSMSAKRYLHTATLLPNGKVLVVGGSVANPDNTPGDSRLAELYDPGAGTWSSAAPMATGRVGHTATLLTAGPDSGKVLVVGGASAPSDAPSLSSAELYDPVQNNWRTLTSTMSAPRADHTATLLPSGKVLVAGGHATYGGVALSSAELYNPDGSWTATADMLGARTNHTATLLDNGKVLVAGGMALHNGSSLASAELYDPSTNAWVSAGNMLWASGRANHTATLLPRGKVLVAGGSYGTADATTRLAELYTPKRH